MMKTDYLFLGVNATHLAMAVVSIQILPVKKIASCVSTAKRLFRQANVTTLRVKAYKMEYLSTNQVKTGK